jgi:DNA repair protein RecO (recombination protein O)
MAQQVSQAIVLHTTDYGELDRIVSLYTREFGRIRAIAKSAKRSQRRFGSSLEPCTHVDAFLMIREHQGLIRLERCECRASFPELARSLHTIAYGHYLLELVQLLTPERQHSFGIFDLLLHFIGLLKDDAFRKELIQVFELRLFALLGYQPQLGRCVMCRQPFSLARTYRFSVQRGGIVCEGCQNCGDRLLPLSKGTIRIFQQAQTLSLLKLNRIFLSPAEHEESRRIFGKFMEYHLDRRPKSLSILDQLAEPGTT